MKDGFAEEFDEPHRLLMKPESLLTSMVKNTDANAPFLYKMAKENFDQKRRANGPGLGQRHDGKAKEERKEDVSEDVDVSAPEVTVSLNDKDEDHNVVT